MQLKYHAAFSLLLYVPSVAVAAPSTLRGKTADLTLDVTGFDRQLGPGSLGGEYERLGQFSRDRLNFSALVDTPPAGFDLERLKRHVLESYDSRFAGKPPSPEAITSPPGFFLSWVEQKSSIRTWLLYFEMLDHGRWLELHFSTVDPKRDTLPAMIALAHKIASGMTFTAKPMGAR